MLYFGFKFAAEGYDIMYVAPLAVLLTGLVMTNYLGFREFRKAGDPAMAAWAAVDLDLWTLLGRDRSKILKGEDCPDWRRLQLRQAVWRSLPLAMVNFYLAGRNIFEIPMCQVAVTPSMLLHANAGADDPANLFFAHLKRQGEPRCLVKGLPFNLTCSKAIPVDTEEIRVIRNLRDMVGNHTAGGLKDTVQEARQEMEHATSSLWSSCHCHESSWRPTQKKLWQDLRQSWILAAPAVHVPYDKPVDYGGLGEGDLFTFNLLLSRELRQNLIQHLDHVDIDHGKKDAQALVTLLRQLNGAKVASDVFSRTMKKATNGKDLTLRLFTNLEKFEFKLGNIPLSSLQQRRDGWLLEFFAASLLMLNASLPLAKHVIEARKVEAVQFKIAVVSHVAVDMICLVSAAACASTSFSIASSGRIAAALVRGQTSFLRSFLLYARTENLEARFRISQGLDARLRDLVMLADAAAARSATRVSLWDTKHICKQGQFLSGTFGYTPSPLPPSFRDIALSRCQRWHRVSGFKVVWLPGSTWLRIDVIRRPCYGSQLRPEHRNPQVRHLSIVGSTLKRCIFYRWVLSWLRNLHTVGCLL